MTLTLTKHQGLGNDFLVALEPHVHNDRFPELARRLCDRRLGVGADGLLVGSSAPGHAARMTLYNADGSRAEMSGNGIRCFAQALARRAESLEPQRIATDAGERLVTLFATSEADVVEASVDMGDVTDADEPQQWHALGTNPDRPVAHLSVGNPHSVVGVDDVAVVDLANLGTKVPHVNLEIVEAGPHADAITMRVHERGAGITSACGTGAVAAATAARRWGLVAPSITDIRVHMDGGSATVTLDQPAAGRAVLTGPAVFIATIEVPDT